MAIIELNATNELRLANLVFGLVFCSLQVLLFARRCAQIYVAMKKKEAACTILNLSGLSVILFGIATCLFIIVSNSRDLENIWDIERRCNIGMKMGTAGYCALRFSVYSFLIYRIDLVDFSVATSVFVKRAKWILVICYIAGVTIAALFAQGSLYKGEEGEVFSCRGRFDPIALFLAAITDFTVCFIALKYFLRPLKDIADESADEVVVHLLHKMRFYGLVMIVSTVVTICIAVVLGGISLIYAVDAGITSLALVWIYEPSDHHLKSGSNNTIQLVSSSDVIQLAGKLSNNPSSTGRSHKSDSVSSDEIRELENELNSEDWETDVDVEVTFTNNNIPLSLLKTDSTTTDNGAGAQDENQATARTSRTSMLIRRLSSLF